jgi:uncharacterized repeat protein (TIGR01451 family)
MAGLVAAGLLTLPGSRAEAATACGTLITNVATCTMTSGFPDFVAYEVSYNATCTVTVLCPPTVRLMKWATTPQCAAGCTVTFQVCIENGSLDTVWAIMITDALPGNTTFALMNAANYDTTLGGPFVLGGGVTIANGPTWTCGVAGAPTAGQAPVWYLRWVVGGIGPSKSACVSYGARIL